ncbi:MAG: MATE family efflux transporter [Oscillospiraceae bacterium]|nr:MATE family efflux transporter [Oscillospiraceae bacterium]
MKRLQKKGSPALNMTEGPVLQMLIAFSVPILIGNAFQQLYNIVDTVVIGNVMGDEALAAVGATSAVYSLVFGFIAGMGNGFSVVLARAFGYGDREQLSRAVSGTAILAAAVSLVLTVISLAAIRPLMAFLGTPEEILSMSLDYLRIILVFCFVTMLYNTLAGMLRAIGNSRVPLYALILASVLNVILDILFVGSFHMGVEGAALATVLAQCAAAGMSLVYIVRACPILHIRRNCGRPERSLMIDLFSTGSAMAFMLVLTNIGTVAMQGAVNTFGVKTITGHTAARKIHDLFMLPFGTICTSAATFVSQNYGAGKTERVKRGVKWSLILGSGWSLAALVIVLLFGKTAVQLLTGTESSEVIQTAYLYLIWNVPFYVILNALLVMRNSVQGLGGKVIPITASMIELIGKFAAAYWLAPALGYLGICLIEPITWAASLPVVGFGYFRAIRKLG